MTDVLIRPSLISDKTLSLGLLFILVAFLIGVGNPALAFLIAAAIALWTNRTLIAKASSYSKYALQTAIVLLGFSMNANNLLTLSVDYAAVVSLYVVITLFFGLMIGWLIKQESVDSKLISTGTAICGGTAIATLSPILRASPGQTGMTLALVFVLNAVALLSFPYAGHWLDLSQSQFGVWTALAIHDTSSVVATAAIYGEEAAQVATTLKLGRTLWLVPVLLVFSIIEGSKDDKNKFVTVPIFIFLFVGASIIASYLDLPSLLIETTSVLSKALLVTALFLVGIATTRDNLKQLNRKHLLQGLIIWIVVVIATLAFVVTKI